MASFQRTRGAIAAKPRLRPSSAHGSTGIDGSGTFEHVAAQHVIRISFPWRGAVRRSRAERRTKWSGTVPATREYANVARAYASLLMLLLCLAPSPAAAADVICHHCVSQAAQWAPVIDAIKRDLRLDVSPDRGESTDEFPNMVENGKPGVDIAYLDAISAVEAKELGLLQP